MVDCKTCEYEKICEMPDFVRNDLKKCRTYLEKKPQTNGQKIRAMSDEELAEFFEKQTMICDFCVHLHEDCDGLKKGVCTEGILAWLKSEVKEEK